MSDSPGISSRPPLGTSHVDYSQPKGNLSVPTQTRARFSSGTIDISPATKAIAQANTGAVGEDFAAVQQSTKPPVRGSRVSIAPREGRLSVMIKSAEGNNLKVELNVAERAKLPGGIPKNIEKLKGWLNENRSDLADIPERVSYEPKDIERALVDFQVRFKCSWAELKHHCEDPKTLQIINDLRSAYLTDMFKQIRAENNGLKNILDFGSTKLTSDRDLAFEVGAGEQTKETEITKRFNELFQAQWGATSAEVFDVNAYTAQYIVGSSDPEIENKRAQIHDEAAIIMEKRNMQPQHWERLQERVQHFSTKLVANPLQQSQVSTQLTSQFANIEQRNDGLVKLHDRKIVELAIIDLAKKEPSLQGIAKEIKENKIPLETAIRNLAKVKVETPLGVVAKAIIEEDDISIISKFADAIKEASPNIAIDASNLLHGEIKSSDRYRTLEGCRKADFATMEALRNAKTPEEFTTTFNKQIDTLQERVKADLKQATDPTEREFLQNRLGQLEKSKIRPGQENDMQKAYMDRTNHETEGKALHEERKKLESYPDRFNKLTAQSAKQEGELQSVQAKIKGLRGFPPTVTLTELNANGSGIHKLLDKEKEIKGKLEKGKQELAQMKENLGIPAEQSLTFELVSAKAKDKINELAPKVVAHQDREEELVDKHGEFFSDAGQVRVEYDRLTLGIQYEQTTGMCFAQEAHISEGAMATVVGRLQAGKSDLLTPNQLSQGLYEPVGFFSGHQHHETTPHSKIVEVSKYGERIVAVANMMEEQAKTMGLSALNFQEHVPDLPKLETFFKEAFASRGKGLSEKEKLDNVNKAARKAGLIEPNETFGEKDLERITNSVIDTDALIKVWKKTVDVNRLNAYY